MPEQIGDDVQALASATHASGEVVPAVVEPEVGETLLASPRAESLRCVVPAPFLVAALRAVATFEERNREDEPIDLLR